MAIKNYPKGSNTQLSANFRAKEFDCPGKGCCSTTPIDEKLVEYLQRIREHFGKPIVPLGYRCPTYNAKTPNAAPRSYHTFGQAADFHIDGVANAEIAKYAESIGILGIGLYDTFVHIDTRTTKSFWYGHGGERRTTFGGAPAETAEKSATTVKVDYAKSMTKSLAGTYRVRSQIGLKLRSGASTQKTILETMPNGSQFVCYGYHTGDWLYGISASGKKGFCHKSLLVKQ